MANTNPNTTEKIAQELTEKSPLLSNLITFETRTPLTEQQAKKKGLPSTPKSKSRLGIDEDRKIIWANPHFSPEDHSIITAFGKSQDIELSTLFARLIMTWYDDNKDEITETADEFIKTENTTDDLLKIAEAAKKKYERTMELLKTRQTIQDAYDEDAKTDEEKK